MTIPNHYETLNLPVARPAQTTTMEDIKRAYRLALLAHHPDKHSPHGTGASITGATGTAVKDNPSVDAIKAAYAVLSDAKLREEYDREILLLLSRKPGTDDRTFHTGEEVVDLDDLAFDEEEDNWYKACRCGEERGYVVTEPQLEDEARKGGTEVVVGCKGCSLWIRVGFGIVDGDDLEAQTSRDKKAT